jgi:hypothetical protein
MAVTFTPNIGLAKPTESELAEDWVNGPQLCSDNNVIIAAKANVVLNSYTPTMIGATTNPNIGVGQALGEYINFQGFIMGSFNIAFLDPGVGAGSGAGAYGFSLPTLVDNSFHAIGSSLSGIPGLYDCIGEGYITDNTAVGSSGTVALDVVRIGGVDYCRMITEAYAGKTVSWLGPTFPFTIATDDKFTASFFYKAA